MSEEDFLTRWSRRKREVAKAEQAPTAPAPDAPAKAPEATASGKIEAEFDPASLPPVESINVLSDVTAFLRDGVPAELTRAALRRVWTADPAIRDFVGLAENAWDFTDPDAMPGFGPLEATDEVRRMIARVVGEIGQLAQSTETGGTTGRSEDVENSNSSKAIKEEHQDEEGSQEPSPQEDLKEDATQPVGSQILLQCNKQYAAMQNGVAEVQGKPKQFSHQQMHGGALPR
jgi:hypothetical protein